MKNIYKQKFSNLGGYKDNLRSYLTTIPSLFILILIILIFPAFSQNRDLSSFQLFIKLFIPYGIIALGLYPVMISGNIDLSQFATAQLAATLAIGAFNNEKLSYFVIPLIIILGGTIGLINGTVISYLQISPVLVTYCMSLILKGIMFIITKGRMVKISQKNILSLWRQNIFGIPILLFGFILCYLFISYLMNKTIIGRKFTALGHNNKVCSYSGYE